MEHAVTARTIETRTRGLRGASRASAGLLVWALAATSNAQWNVVNQHPAGAIGDAIAYGVSASQQIGHVDWGGGGYYHASLWTGTAESWQDLNPIGWDYSEACGVGGEQQ